MKLIIAIIQPDKLERVKQALSEVEVFRLTILDVQGFGRQLGHAETYRGHEIAINLLRKVQLQIAINDEFVERHGKADVVITDPPRNGMHTDVIKQLLKLGSEKIVYISCNSATQARDLELMKNDYSVLKSQAVDMFPQTHHVENVVLLQRNEINE